MPTVDHDVILKRTLSRPSGLATFLSAALETEDDEYIRYAIQKVKQLTGLNAAPAVRDLQRSQEKFASLKLRMRAALEQEKKGVSRAKKSPRKMEKRPSA